MNTESMKKSKYLKKPRQPRFTAKLNAKKALFLTDTYGCTLAWIEYSFYSLPLKNDLKSKSSSILNASINDACASYIHQFAKKKKEEIERENTNLEYSHAMKVL